MTILRRIMTDEKYIETIRENFLKWAGEDTGLLTEKYKDIIGLMYLAWLEATRQADERNSIK